MSFFNPLEGTVLLRKAGVFTEAKLFERDGKIYAKRGSGYVRLLSHDLTTVRDLRWSQIKGTPFREVAGDVLVSFPQLSAA